jgi:hypothetical protein
MKDWIRKRWQSFLRPVYRIEITVLLFGIILFNYFYFGRKSSFDDLFDDFKIIKLLFFIYTPLILIFAFIQVPSSYKKLAQVAAFACTLLGMVVIEVVFFDEIRRPGFFEICYHSLILFQLAKLTWLLVTGLKAQLDPDKDFNLRKLDLKSNLVLNDQLKMEMEPDWISTVIALICVFGGTFLFQLIPKVKPYLIAEYTFLSGSILLWILQSVREVKQKKSMKHKAENSSYTKAHR